MITLTREEAEQVLKLLDTFDTFNDFTDVREPLRAKLSEPQREWVVLTDEEIQKSYETSGHYQTLRPQDSFAVYALARAVEAKLKEKNA